MKELPKSTWLVVVAACAFAVGCQKPAEQEKPATTKASLEKPEPAKQAGSSETVAPMGGVGAGPMTPVSGSDSVAGGGSGVGTAIKSKAKDVAGQASSQGAGTEDTEE